MIEYIHKGDESTVRAAGNMAQICAEVTYLIHRLWVAVGDRGEEFKQLITDCINAPDSPVFRRGDATENAMTNPMEKAMEDAMEETAWKEEAALYEDAVKHVGETAQIMQAIEEMAELIQALNKYLRYNQFGQGNLVDVLQKIQEERADVEIMLNQLHVIFGDNSEAECKKLEHLRKLLQPEKTWEV